MTNHTRSSQVSLAALLLAGLSAACMNDPLAGTSPPDDGGVTPGAGTVATTTSTGGGGTTIPTGGTGGSTASTDVTQFWFLEGAERAVDILFVVDNSPSMDPKQTALATNFAMMKAILRNGDGARLLDPANNGWSPATDFDLCLDLDRFDFVLKLTKEVEYSMLKTVEVL